jgi:hypothetical protein
MAGDRGEIGARPPLQTTKISKQAGSGPRTGPQRGAYYCAIGEDYARMAEVSAASLRRHNPSLPITVFTDQEISCHRFDKIIELEKPDSVLALRLQKIRIFEKIRAKRGLYLDCDAFVAGNIMPLFALMNRYDIAVAYDLGRHVSEPLGTHMNSGVIVFNNNERTRELWRTWQHRFEKRPRLLSVVRDQPAFEYAVKASKVRMFVLAPEFNMRLAPLGGQIAGEVKIFHGPHHMIRNGSIASLARFINSESGIRIFDWRSGQMQMQDITGVVGNNHSAEYRTRSYCLDHR